MTSPSRFLRSAWFKTPCYAALIVLWFCVADVMAQDLQDAGRDNEVSELHVQFPSKDRALTSNDLKKLRYAFNRRTLVDAYEQVGDHNEKWDQPATEFLDEMARYFSGLIDDRSKFADVLRDSNELLKLGCSDPLVRYCHAVISSDVNKTTIARGKAIQLIEEVYPMLVVRRYPALRCFAAANRLREHYQVEGKESKRKKYFDACWKHSLQMIPQDDSSRNESLPVVDSVLRFFDEMPSQLQGNYFFTAKKLESDSPWLVNVLGGELHLNKAWAGRGSGWAYDVTNSQWEIFAEHLQRARRNFERAWEICPTRPHAAAGMIVVAMADNSEPHDAMQVWFERAIHAQLDYLPAYHRMFNGLKPRWHGSHEEMLELGRLAARTQAYDTDVPYMLCEALWLIMNDFQNDQGDGFLIEHDLFPEIEDVCQHYIVQREQQGSSPQWWKTVYAGFAFIGERYDLAKRLINELDDKLDANALSRFPLREETLVTAVYRLAGPFHERIKNVDQSLADRDFSKTMVLIESLLKEPDLRPDVAKSLRSDLQVCQWLLAFEQGESVQLLPDDELTGWSVLAGKWVHRDTGALRGESIDTDKGGLLAMCQADFGDRWVLNGDYVRGGSRDSLGTAGIYLYDGRHAEYSIIYNHSGRWLTYGRPGDLSENQRKFEPKSKVVPFEIHFDRGNLSIWMDYRELVKRYTLSDFDPEQSLRIVVGTLIAYDDAVLTLRNLTIQRLPAEEEDHLENP